MSLAAPTSSLNYYVHAHCHFRCSRAGQDRGKIHGSLKTATFEKVSEQNKGERITVPFEMLHVSPPQSPPDEIKSSPLVNAAGWVEVNQNSMQHVRYPNVFSLGDVSSTPKDGGGRAQAGGGSRRQLFSCWHPQQAHSGTPSPCPARLSPSRRRPSCARACG